MLEENLPSAPCLTVADPKRSIRCYEKLGFPALEGGPKETARREERSLKQLWDLLVSGRLPGAEEVKENFRRELDAIDAFLSEPGQDLGAFVQKQRAALSSETTRRTLHVALAPC